MGGDFVCFVDIGGIAYPHCFKLSLHDIELQLFHYISRLIYQSTLLSIITMYMEDIDSEVPLIPRYIKSGPTMMSIVDDNVSKIVM